MSGPGLAFAAALAGVFGAWDALSLMDRAALPRLARRVAAPVLAAGTEGREPSHRERRQLAALSAVALLVAGWLVAGPLAGLALAAAAPSATLAVVRARRRRWRGELSDSAPAVARALADALGAGHSVPGAVIAAAETGGMPGAAGGELQRAAEALRLGEPAETVLETLRARAASRPWDVLVAAVLLQRDAGGDLARLLRDLAAAQEAALREERDVCAATAQARFTGVLVCLMPLGAAVLAELASPGYLGQVAANPFGPYLAGLAIALQIVAIVAIRHLARPS